MAKGIQGKKEAPIKEIPAEKKFEILSAINRMAHFEWRRAALALCPKVKPMDFVLKYWEEVGHDTAQAYLKRMDKSKPVAPQIAASFVWSSHSMGEDAHLYEGDNPKEAYMLHKGCPWYVFHKREGLLGEDQPGCDKWLEVLIDDINKALGSHVKWETLESLPGGGGGCVRRLWED